jgi:tetratricopeptide (TPR) repeat protein
MASPPSIEGRDKQGYGGEISRYMMPVSAPQVRLEHARQAAARGAWAEAHELFCEAASAGILPPSDLPLVAQVAYAAGHLDVTIETWERAYAESARAGDNLGAAGAAVRIAMHLLFDTAMMAPVRGWLARAERLLGEQGDTPVHAWFAVVRNYERLLSGDAEGARAWARRAVEIGGRTDPAAAAIGRVADARGLVLAGEVEEGLALLDEAGVAATSGELDPLSRGVVYCELVCALQGLAQYDLAEQWTNAMERWSVKNAIGSIHGRCRVHKGEILCLRGSLDAAEHELTVACDELRPYLRRELGWPLVELGRVRLRRGDIDGAEEALLAAHDVGWDAQLGLALARLARGDVDLAAASIREAIAKPSYVPSKELPPATDLRRVGLYEAQVEIALRAGDREGARVASVELARIANRFRSKALTAGAALARGRVVLADGGAAEAVRSFEEAVRLWHDVGAPYEGAIARRGLADAHRANGHLATAELEERAARATLERIGAAVSTSPARPAASRPPEVASDTNVDDVLRCEGDTWAITFQGRTIRVRDRKGMHYLARMIEAPQRELHVLDLVGAESAEMGAEVHGDAGPLLDAKAKDAYRRRIAEIEEDIDEAERLCDLGRAAHAKAERDLLVRELSRAFGVGGRERPAAGSAAERARASVTRAIRQALLKITEHHQPLGAHLDRTIKTGAYCAYAPDPRAPVSWTVIRAI